ncbi:MAG: hypothetical protein ABFC24_11435 [Methanoregulaceae archaeon]
MARKKEKAIEKRDSQPSTFFGIPLKYTTLSDVKKNLALLVCLSLVVKVGIVLLTTQVFHSFIDMFDTSIYLQYGLNIFSGQIPYVNFTVEYPQLFFIPVLIATTFAIISQSAAVFILSFQGLMTLCDLGSLVCVYTIALKLFDARRAFLAGFLYATAFSSAYFVLTKYDAFPVFLLMLSLLLYIVGKDIGGYIASVTGFFVKWFPIFSAVYFVLHHQKEKKALGDLKIPLLAAVALGCIVVLPFLILNVSGFFATYTGHFGRAAEAPSFVYYLDMIAASLFQIQSIDTVIMAGMVLVELALLYLYFTRAGTGHLVMSYFIFFSLFIFVISNKVLSPQYLLWIAPFFALFLCSTLREMVAFYLVQLVFYLEFPLLFGTVYTSTKEYIPSDNLLLSSSFAFFTLKFAVLLGAVVYLAYKMKKSCMAEEPVSP